MAEDYLKNVSIMIVDDQEFVCRLIREVLHVIGAQQIYMFTNPMEAWAEFKVRPTDIVILDWNMGPPDGLELTRLIRKDESSPNPLVPIIMVTAHGEMSRVLKARDAGVNEYIIKPISPKALYGRIEAVIERPRRFVRIGEFFGPDRRRQTIEFEGEDKRGHDAPPVEVGKKPVDKKRQMGQEEVNDLFNPDDAARKAAEKAEKAGKSSAAD